MTFENSLDDIALDSGATRVPPTVLVVDDEAGIREVLVDFLSMEGYAVVAVADGEAAMAHLEEHRADVMLLDMKLPGISGLEVLERSRRLVPDLLVVMMTGFGTVETAVSAMKNGAYDYLLKPFKIRDVIRLIERGLEKKALEAQNIQLKEALNLYHLSERMARDLAIEPLYDILMETARQETGADAIGLWCTGTEGSASLEPVRMWGALGQDVSRRVALEMFDIRRLAALTGVKGAIFDGHEARTLIDTVTDRPPSSMLSIPLHVNDRVLGYLVALSFDPGRPFGDGKRKLLSILGHRAAAALENARLYGDLQQTFKQTIQGLANILEDKDPYTRGHSERVSRYARLIAETMGLSLEEVERVADSALMHDIGKLGIRFEELNKAEPLTFAEYEMFKSHTTRGKWLLEPITFLHPLIPGVYHHHERWDGKGYPMGLKGEQTPLMARILSVADTFDAMTSHRAYRRALPIDIALSELEECAQTQFDPVIVEAFLTVMKERSLVRLSRASRWQSLLDAT
jgi:response regulator RpfG family c-di-GMP phosphodiesterase